MPPSCRLHHQHDTHNTPLTQIHTTHNFNTTHNTHTTHTIPHTEANKAGTETSGLAGSSLVEVEEVTDKSIFAAYISSPDLTVVDYWAPWCK